MGTIFLVYIHISREISIEHPSVGLASLAQLCMYVCMYVGMSRMSNYLRRRNYVAQAHAQSHFWAVMTDLVTPLLLISTTR